MSLKDRYDLVIFDWAGTMVDFGSAAPVKALIEAFGAEGVIIDEAAARRDMGKAKRDHVRGLLMYPSVAAAWQARHGRAADATDMERVMVRLGPLMRDQAARASTLIPGARETFDQIRAESVASQTFAMRLLVGFSLAGSVLALVGLYGVLSLSVGSRKREIAIRMAVGAQPRDVLGVILTEGMKLIIAGLALGTGVALVLARVLKALLFGVAPADPMTFAGVALFFTAVALLACCIPARRAATIDPMTALRYE